MEPTFRGFIDTTHDALVLLEACTQQQCDRVTRRLQEKERQQITSGSVYVFDEEESRIKRWTDGRMWSPSRILGNFLVYRELDKRNVDEEALVSAALSRAEEERLYGGVSDETNPRSGRNRERSLVGSLTSTFKFKKGGLVKKTLSVSTLHLICYYCVEDVLEGRLRTPSSLPELLAFSISPPLLNPSCFRVPPKVEYAPDGTPTFVAERDENAPPRPSTSRSSFASSSSSILSPTDSNFASTSDYFGFPSEGTGSAASSASSGEVRTGSAGSGSYGQSPRLSLNPPLPSRVHTVGGGATRNISSRSRHNPYGPTRSVPSDMQLPSNEDLPQHYDAYRPAESFSNESSASMLYNPIYDARNPMPPSPASATFGYTVPSQPGSYPSQPFDLMAHRNSLPSVPRPYTSYDAVNNAGTSPTAAEFVRSISDHGRNRTRASTGPSTVSPRQQGSGSNHLSWHSEGAVAGASQHSIPDESSSGSHYLGHPHANERSACQPFPSLYSTGIGHDRQQSYNSSFPSPLSNYFPPNQNYSVSQPYDRPASPRSTAPSASPFYFNAPTDTATTSGYPSLNLNGDSLFNSTFGRRVSAGEHQYLPRPSGLVQPIPQYPSQISRYSNRLETESEEPDGAHHVPLWLQQQQQSVVRQ